MKACTTWVLGLIVQPLPYRGIPPAALLLRPLLYGAASAPRGPRRAAVPPQVWPGLAGVLQARALPDPTLCLLKPTHVGSWPKHPSGEGLAPHSAPQG